MFRRLKSVCPTWCYQVHRRHIYLHSPVFCKEDNGKPPGVPSPLVRRTKLSPEDRMRAMLENASDAHNETIDKGSDEPNNPAINSDKDSHVKKPHLAWKFGRRRSISPLSRVQGMLDDQDKNDK
jgi:hypothetical protein